MQMKVNTKTIIQRLVFLKYFISKKLENILKANICLNMLSNRLRPFFNTLINLCIIILSKIALDIFLNKSYKNINMREISRKVRLKRSII